MNDNLPSEEPKTASKFVKRLQIQDKIMAALFVIGCSLLLIGIPHLLASQRTQIPLLQFPHDTGTYAVQLNKQVVGCVSKESRSDDVKVEGFLNIITELAANPSDIQFTLQLSTEAHSPQIRSLKATLYHESDVASVICDEDCEVLEYEFTPIHRGSLKVNRSLTWKPEVNGDVLSAQTDGQIIELTLRAFGLVLRSTGLQMYKLEPEQTCEAEGTAVPAGLVYDFFKIWKRTNTSFK